MPDRPTDHHHLDLTRLNLDVAFGQAGGKVIWQPRILAWYDDKLFFNQALPRPYAGMTRPQLYRALGCSNRIYEFNACFVPHEDPAVRITQTRVNDTDTRVLIETPVGAQEAVYRASAYSRGLHPLKRPITNEHEMRVALWRHERMTWSWDQTKYDELCATWRGLGAPTVHLPRPGIQKLYIEDMGVEPAVYALEDYPDTCAAYFAAIDLSHRRLLQVVSASPIRIINFGDNVHASTTPPRLFEKYLLPGYQWRSALLHEAGKFVHAHWDGDTAALLPYARQTGLDGIEAITPRPQGDVTLEQARAALGDKMFLLDGIPAVFFDRTYPEQVLIDCARRCIELFAPRLILGASDEVSAQGDIERVRLVGQVVDDYNATL